MNNNLGKQLRAYIDKLHQHSTDKNTMMLAPCDYNGKHIILNITRWLESRGYNCFSLTTKEIKGYGFLVIAVAPLPGSEIEIFIVDIYDK